MVVVAAEVVVVVVDVEGSDVSGTEAADAVVADDVVVVVVGETDADVVGFEVAVVCVPGLAEVDVEALVVVSVLGATETPCASVAVLASEDAAVVVTASGEAVDIAGLLSWLSAEQPAASSTAVVKMILKVFNIASLFRIPNVLSFDIILPTFLKINSEKNGKVF